MAALALGAATSACVVFPVPHIVAPEVTGVLLGNGMPVENAEIVLVASLALRGAASEIPDGSRRAVTRTDANGKFKVGPLIGTKVVHTFGDELLGYYLLIRVRGDELIGFNRSEIGSVRPKITGSCDLAKPNKDGSDVTYCDHYRLQRLSSER
ncbi:hypothetical protein [Roseibium aggregatum]|uniref:Uncharacterized protein n=1 Tax=Roseibium aggregatum TaxID=187304 RepID=A0A939J3S0_9HYPH|nr:hypothetical protein [Roseibium aggregatum]MBN9672793.1 hypothetical protein [Roseibium aggregatum]